MAEKIVIELDLERGDTNKAFNEIEQQANTKGQKVGLRFGESFSRGIRSAIQFAGGFAAISGLTNILNSSIRAAVGFEKAVTEINTILPANTKLTEQQTSALRQLGRQFGTGATQQAKTFYQVVSAGVTDAAAATRVLNAANKLAIGGLTDVNSSVDILTTIINSYGAANIDAQEAADSLFTAVRLGKTTVDELASSLALVIPSANAAGVEIDTVNAAVATLTSNGRSTSRAVTELNALLASFARNGEKLGEGLDIAAIKSDGLVKVLQRLQKRTGGQSGELIKLLGSVEAFNAAQTLSSNGAQQFANTLDEFTDKAGAANKAYGEFTKTASFQFNQLRSELNDIAIRLGTQLLPIVVSTTRGFSSLIKTLTGVDRAPNEISKVNARLTEQRGILNDLVDDLAEAEAKQKDDSLLGRLLAPTEAQIAKQKEAVEAQRAIVNELIQERARLIDQNAQLDQRENENLQNNSDQKNAILKSASAATQKELAKLLQAANKIINQGLANSISGGVQNIVNNLMEGKNAFSNFSDFIINTFGDLAIQLGQFYIAQGLANAALLSVNPGAQIATGAALVALGTILKSFAGSGLSAGAGGSGGGVAAVGAEPAPGEFTTDLAEPTAREAEERVNLSLNVEGSLVRESELEGYVSRLLEEGGRTNARVIPSVRTA